MKRTVFFRKFTSALLAFAAALSFADISAFAEDGGYFEGQLLSGSVSDLSGIKLDIYRSVLSHDGGAFEKYTHKYVSSVYTDEDGEFSFKRPTGMFVVTADMSTLPRKTGITENMWTVADSSVTAFTADVEKIADINIVCENAESGEVGVNITDGGGNAIYCNYTVDISDADVTETVIDDTGKRKFHMERKITVRANGRKKTQIVESESVETAVPVVSLQKPEFDYPRSYTETGGFFEIHYDEFQYGIETVKNVYGTLKDAKAFYDSYGFKEPIKESGSEKYNVYLVTEGVASATTKHVKKGSGYIILQTPKDYNRQKHLFITSTIAHELFHGVMNAYTRRYGITPSKWFREAFANWAGIEFLGYSTATPRQYVNIFQSNPELSLTDTFDSRVYGSMMFALTIYEDFGGMDTIKLILKEFRKAGKSDAPEFTAMNNALAKAKKNGSFKKAFIRFALNNMYPAAFYSLPGSEKWNKAARSAPTITKDLDMKNLEFKPLSAKYFDAEPDLLGQDLYITIAGNDGEYGDAGFCLLISGTDGMSRYYTSNINKMTTFRIKDLTWSKTVKVSFGLINASVDETRDMNVKILYA